MVYFNISYFIEISVKIVLFYISKQGFPYFVHVYIEFQYSRRFRSSHPEVFLVKSVLEKCNKFTGEHPCQSVILIKLQSNFIEIILRYECCPVNWLHIFRTPVDCCFWRSAQALYSLNANETFLMFTLEQIYTDSKLKVFV